MDSTRQALGSGCSGFKGENKGIPRIQLRHEEIRNRSELVNSQYVGKISATPSSVAFSTIKSVRDFFIGEKNSQISGGAKEGLILFKHFNVTIRLFPPTISASHSPSLLLKIRIWK